MTTSELTTGEIVQSLRCDGYCSRCEKWDGGDLPCPVMIEAADRLESQERELFATKTRLDGLIAFYEKNEKLMESNHRVEIHALTARAEQAEKERDFFIEKISGRCAECKHEHLYSYVEPCESCHNANGHPNWE